MLNFWCTRSQFDEYKIRTFWDKTVILYKHHFITKKFLCRKYRKIFLLIENELWGGEWKLLWNTQDLKFPKLISETLQTIVSVFAHALVYGTSQKTQTEKVLKTEYFYFYYLCCYFRICRKFSGKDSLLLSLRKHEKELDHYAITQDGKISRTTELR